MASKVAIESGHCVSNDAPSARELLGAVEKSGEKQQGESRHCQRVLCKTLMIRKTINPANRQNIPA